MFRSHLLAAMLGVALLTPPMLAQRQLYPSSPLLKPQIMPYPVNRNQYVAPNTTARQMSYNMSTIGRGMSHIPPYMAGYNPYVHSVVNTRPAVAPVVVAPSFSSASPYSMRTGGGGWGGGGWGGGWGYTPNSMGYGFALQGIADYTRASGQYWNDIQSARMSREKVSQEQIETQRKRIEWEMEYEKLRPTAPKMRDAERATDLDWARNDPPSSEIWSGRTLNVLLRSIFNAPSPTRGPNISLEPDTVRGLNLTDKTTRASLSLAKDEGKIEWTDSLQESAFDTLREDFSKKFDQAMKGVNSGEAPPRALVQDLRNDLKGLSDKLDDMVRDLTPSGYIGSRRLLNQLNDTVKGLSNPRLVKTGNSSWRRSVNTVADLVDHCLKNGLEFGPAAASGDEPAYTAAYYAIRAYERGVTTTLSTASN